jgi:hypothetical protein
MKKLKSNQMYWALIKVQNNGQLKVAKANKYVAVNQHKKTWESTNARKLARIINSNKIVIN